MSIRNKLFNVRWNKKLQVLIFENLKFISTCLKNELKDYLIQKNSNQFLCGLRNALHSCLAKQQGQHADRAAQFKFLRAFVALKN